MKTISAIDYDQARNNYMGWCTFCEDFTTDIVEPDAENYVCEVCGESAVIGAEDAMLMEKFYIEDDKYL
jgi:hypothetical protein